MVIGSGHHCCALAFGIVIVEEDVNPFPITYRPVQASELPTGLHVLISKNDVKTEMLTSPGDHLEKTA